MSSVADAEQPFAVPFAEPINLDGEQFDFGPIIELGHATVQKIRHGDEVALEHGQSACFDLIEVAFGDHVAALPTFAAVDQDKELAVPKKAKRLFGIAVPFRNAHPKHIDRHAKLANFEAAAVAYDGTAAVGPDYQVGTHFEVAIGRFCTEASYATSIYYKIDNFVFHTQVEPRKTFGVTGQKIQKIPLRHESDELASGRQVREIGDGHCMAINEAAQFAHLLMWLLQEFIQEPELVH